jgi:dienelactone hydrolase
MTEAKLGSGEQGNIFYKSSNPFEFFHIINEVNSPEQEMFGTLIFPDQKKELYPLVICIHGSLGWRGHHHEHIVNFLESGMAVFRVHSFDARQVSSIVEDQMQVTLASIITDCFCALKLLQTHPEIDKKNISIAGWSLGGSTALYSAWEPLAEKLAPSGERFSAHLAFYPGAYIWPEEMRWSEAPILSLIGKIDDYTPPILIEKLSSAINDNLGNSQVIYYEDSHHSFDSIEPLMFEPNAITCGTRHSQIDKKGNLYFQNDEGIKYLLNEPEDRANMFKASSGIKGGHLGGNWISRKQSMKDSVDFLQNNLI